MQKQQAQKGQRYRLFAVSSLRGLSSITASTIGFNETLGLNAYKKFAQKFNSKEEAEAKNLS
ncbi:MAG: hypothetical protein NWF00_12015 [Candidatus Bathyarchaeota archaeon]|nr:hypothetical protein [Candidatus Bathyarchaeota archaeon]